MLQAATRRATEDYHVWARSEQLTVQAIRSTRSWRLSERFVPASRNSVSPRLLESTDVRELIYGEPYDRIQRREGSLIRG